MQFLTTIAVLTSVVAAAYRPCPNGKGKPVCCTLGADGVELLCGPSGRAPIRSLQGFKYRCNSRTPKCCKTSALGVAAVGCSAPAGEKPPPPTAYVPCKSGDSPFCCQRDLLDNIKCKDGPVTPNPKSFADFTATCKAQDNTKAYCCGIDAEGDAILCGIAAKQ